MHVKSLFAVLSFCVAAFKTHHSRFVKRSPLIPKIDRNFCSMIVQMNSKNSLKDKL